jgi:hypothetical protein
MALFILAIDTTACPAPLLRQHCLWINPQPIPPLSSFVLSPFPHRISRCILLIPPASAVFNSCVVDVGAIGQDHISKVRLYLSRPCSGQCLACFAVGLACLRAVDAAGGYAQCVGCAEHRECRRRDCGSPAWQIRCETHSIGKRSCES